MHVVDVVCTRLKFTAASSLACGDLIQRPPGLARRVNLRAKTLAGIDSAWGHKAVILRQPRRNGENGIEGSVCCAPDASIEEASLLLDTANGDVNRVNYHAVAQLDGQYAITTDYAGYNDRQCGEVLEVGI